MISIEKNTKIYVLIPAKIESGGPEFLHQLANYLRYKLKIESYLFFSQVGDNTIPMAYKRYNNFVSSEIEDRCENIIISPEIPRLLVLMSNYVKVQKIIWWLSIDNYFYDQFLLMYPKTTFLIKSLNKTILISNPIDIITVAKRFIKKFEISKNPLVLQAKYNFCSARHVQHYLESLKLLNVNYISELINEEYLDLLWSVSDKKDFVVYNPKKGLKFTNRLIKKGSYIKFVPLINLNSKEIVELLKKAKVYIDFGNHPGRDRMPREAAILGCCIITNLVGGANLYEDMPISDEYKFLNFHQSIDEILEKIEQCFHEYDTRIRDFEYYRQIIKSEPEFFLTGLNFFFTKK